MKHEVLLEIFSEEIPASAQKMAAEKLRYLVLENFHTNHNTEVKILVSPRHFVLHLSNFDLFASLKADIRGPRVNASQEAIEGFMKKYNIGDVEELIVVDDFFILKYEPTAGQINVDLGILLIEILQKINWSKTMLWGSYEKIQWPRPIHSIICFLDKKIVKMKFGHIISGNTTLGHKAMNSPIISFSDSTLDNYKNTMREFDVIVSQDERKESILKQIESITNTLQLNLINDPELLDEIVGLVENPHVILGKINDDFMLLPKEVLILTLKFHQKYLLLENSKKDLAPYFIIVSDIKPINNETIVGGNEKVVRARLNDAQHFIEVDLKQNFVDRTELLHAISFHKVICTVYEKVQKIVKLSEKILEQCCEIGSQLSVYVKKAAAICKNDLTTQMVNEFPELQGIIGGYYCDMQGEDKEISIAVKEHYKPCGPNDAIPSTIVGNIVALADKLSTLDAMFSFDIKATSSKDPYALRRAALGILRIILGNKTLFEKISLKDLNIREDIIKFLEERAKNMTQDNFHGTTSYEELLQIIRR